MTPRTIPKSFTIFKRPFHVGYSTPSFKRKLRQRVCPQRILEQTLFRQDGFAKHSGARVARRATLACRHGTCKVTHYHLDIKAAMARRGSACAIHASGFAEGFAEG